MKWTLFFVIFLTVVEKRRAEEEALVYATALISSYSPTNTSLSRDEFKTLFKSFRLEVWEVFNEDDGVRDDALCDKVLSQATDIGCAECTEIEKVFDRYAVNAELNSSALLKALPAVAVALKHEQCQYRATTNDTMDDGEYHPRKPTEGEVWCYSVGVVLLVCLISNLGAFLTPMMKTDFFQKVLLFLVAVAIGTQAGAGILVLIPESLHLMYHVETMDTYLWKVTAVVGGILFIIILERILKISFHRRKTAKERTMIEISVKPGSTVTMTTIGSLDNEDDIEKCNGKPISMATTNMMNNHSNGVVCITEKNGIDAAKESNNVNNSNNSISKTDVSKDVKEYKQEISTIAWMVLLGDAIHKAVDGLSVGAAFSQTFTTGLTLAISIICEEIPHELGDISILLHSGMTMKQALFYNTLSAACGIPGVIAGILLGSTPEANQWIFAIAAGIFIYVPLADMLPEMSHVIEKALKEETGAIFLSILQLIGLCLGFGVIVLVASYAHEIQV